VVRVHFQVAVRLDRQVHETMPTDLIEHVLEKRQAGRNVDLAAAIEIDLGGNPGFERVALDFRCSL